MKNLLSTLCLFAVFFTATTQAASDKPFPGRKVYEHVPYIEIGDLYKKRKDVVIVDVRSSLEYQTLRVKGSKHISVGSSKFVKKVKELRSKTKKPIIFYCNGHTCFKSYKATNKAMVAKIENVFAFDAGIFDWTKAYPKQAVLLGHSPVNPKHLLSKKTLKKRLLAPKDFAKKVGPKSVTIDVRSRLQRMATGLFPFDEKWASMNDRPMLDVYIEKAKRQNKPLLAYDAVGKQVRWLQYYLEKKGLKKYYFMKGGAEGYYKMLFARDGHQNIYEQLMTEGLRKKSKKKVAKK